MGSEDNIRGRVLLVEDEAHLLENIRLNLELENFEVETSINGKLGFEKFKEQRFDLVILDVMMPEISGIELCERIRLEDQETPILFLTAKNTGADRVKGLKVGADDYLAKPFNLEELILRVKVLIKRTSNKSHEVESKERFVFGSNQILFSSCEAVTSKGRIDLTKKETMLLKLLTDRKNEVVSREQILQYVWGYDVYPTTRTIDNFILAFRKYFEEDSKTPKFFLSVRGIGYKFVER